MSLINPISVPSDAVRDTCAAWGRHPDSFSVPGGGRLRTTFVRAGLLAPRELQRWAALSRDAAPGNIFAADWLMGPALALTGHRHRLAVVEDEAGGWLGALPVGLGMLSARVPVPVLRSWHCPAGGIGTPVLRAGAERAFWETLLGSLDRSPGLAAGLIAEGLPLDDPATLALASLCAEQGRRLLRVKSTIRPARIAGEPGDPRAIAVLAKRLARLEARLADRLGPVRLALHNRSGDCEPWLAAFLALERGTGQARPAPDALRSAIREGHRRGAVRLVSLSAGGAIIAMSGWLVADRCGYGLATAHDTRLAAYAPHLLLMRRVNELAALEGLVRFDVCGACVPGAAALWPARREFASFGIGIAGPGRRALFARAIGAGVSEGRD